jgi:hypothetical protein
MAYRLHKGVTQGRDPYPRRGWMRAVTPRILPHVLTRLFPLVHLQAGCLMVSTRTILLKRCKLVAPRGLGGFDAYQGFKRHSGIGPRPDILRHNPPLLLLSPSTLLQLFNLPKAPGATLGGRVNCITQHN